LTLTKIDPDAFSKEWNEYIFGQATETGRRYSIGHNPSLAGIFKSVFSYTPEYYALYDGNSLGGLLPGFRISNRFVSIPIFPTAGIYSNSQSDYAPVLEYLRSYEIKDFKKLSQFCNDSKVTCHLSLCENENAQFETFTSKLRSQINKGYKNGIVVRAGGPEAVDDFYPIYAENMHRLGSPVLSKAFFQEIMLKYEFGHKRVFVAYHENKPAGASVVLTYGSLAEVGWASTVVNYNRLNTNMVLYWEMIKFAITSGMKSFSFGRATKDSSTYKFKQQWGVENYPIFFNYSHSHVDIRKFKLLSAIWKKLPAKLVDTLGPEIRKRLSI